MLSQDDLLVNFCSLTSSSGEQLVERLATPAFLSGLLTSGKNCHVVC
jgi:hypothetical protein